MNEIYNGIIRKDPGHYKIGTHDVRKSLFLRVYNHYKIGTHDVKKTLIRFKVL
jgi:ATP-dependent protease Clp ATPase subunit